MLRALCALRCLHAGQPASLLPEAGRVPPPGSSLRARHPAVGCTRVSSCCRHSIVRVLCLAGRSAPGACLTRTHRPGTWPPASARHFLAHSLFLSFCAFECSKSAGVVVEEAEAAPAGANGAAAPAAAKAQKAAAKTEERKEKGKDKGKEKKVGSFAA